PLLLETCETIHDLAPDAGLEPRLAAIAVAARLDTRPQHRLAFGRLAGRVLLMLPLAEDLTASAARAATPIDAEAQAAGARLTDDRPRLETLLEQPTLTPAQEAVLLTQLRETSTADSASIAAAYARCIARHPESWHLVSDFAEYAGRDLKAYP